MLGSRAGRVSARPGRRTDMPPLKGRRSIYLFVILVASLLAGPDLPGGRYAGAREAGNSVKTSVPGGSKAAGESVKEGDMTDTDRLTEEEGKYLLSIARKTIEAALSDRKDTPSQEDVSGKFSERRGTFVTLTIEENLRGCIGHIVPQESLLEGVRVNAINAAFRDPRFRPLSPREWEKVKIEVSILTEPKTLPYTDAKDLLEKLRPGVDGVIIKKGYHQATFLPQVWEQLPDKKEFLTHLCLKAGLDQDAWKKEGLEVLIYQVQAFEE